MIQPSQRLKQLCLISFKTLSTVTTRQDESEYKTVIFSKFFTVYFTSKQMCKCVHNAEMVILSVYLNMVRTTVMLSMLILVTATLYCMPSACTDHINWVESRTDCSKVVSQKVILWPNSLIWKWFFLLSQSVLACFMITVLVFLKSAKFLSKLCLLMYIDNSELYFSLYFQTHWKL